VMAAHVRACGSRSCWQWYATALTIALNVGGFERATCWHPGLRVRSVTRIDSARVDATNPWTTCNAAALPEPHGRSVLRVGGIARRACARAKRNQPGLRLARAPEGRVRGEGKLNQR
jgi:hypothetical protein